MKIKFVILNSKGHEEIYIDDKTLCLEKLKELESKNFWMSGVHKNQKDIDNLSYSKVYLDMNILNMYDHIFFHQGLAGGAKFNI